jgi:hypothetical protein
MRGISCLAANRLASQEAPKSKLSLEVALFITGFEFNLGDPVSHPKETINLVRLYPTLSISKKWRLFARGILKSYKINHYVWGLKTTAYVGHGTVQRICNETVRK